MNNNLNNNDHEGLEKQTTDIRKGGSSAPPGQQQQSHSWHVDGSTFTESQAQQEGQILTYQKKQTESVAPNHLEKQQGIDENEEVDEVNEQYATLKAALDQLLFMILGRSLLHKAPRPNTAIKVSTSKAYNKGLEISQQLQEL